MARKKKLNPSVIITIDTSSILNIPIIVSTSTAEILYMTSVPKSTEYYYIRKNIISTIKTLKEQYNVDTILLEQNKLFIDKIDKYPDPYILKNVLLGFGIQTSIEDNFYESLTILSVPDYEWAGKVLNKKARYSIDLYKAHILNRTNIPIKFLVTIENNNYYKAICLSECVLFDSLMDRKYQINKGE